MALKSSVSFKRLNSLQKAIRLFSTRNIPDVIGNGGNCADFPGAKAPYVTEMKFLNENSYDPIPIYRILDNNGEVIDSREEPDINNETLVNMYKTMIQMNQMDKILYESQRQGRISFYMTNYGEEGIHVGSAAALAPEDLVFAQYRELGVLLYRGMTVTELVNQCYGNHEDPGKGRQMPVHYGSKQRNVVTISSPLDDRGKLVLSNAQIFDHYKSTYEVATNEILYWDSNEQKPESPIVDFHVNPPTLEEIHKIIKRKPSTQMPQAVGASYACRRSGAGRVVVCYFGDGAASEGDAHAAFNFAATLQCPVIMFCRNNGYAISTPTREQYRGDGVAGRGPAAGLHTLRVDGTDALAVYAATRRARQLAANNEPVLIEAMSYRVGHHSTSDDSSAYRPTEEIHKWSQEESPVRKLRLYLERKGLVRAEQEASWSREGRERVLGALQHAERQPLPPWSDMMHDVYYDMPPILVKQMQQMEKHLEKYKEHYPIERYQRE